jgi:hypothetical protein
LPGQDLSFVAGLFGRSRRGENRASRLRARGHAGRLRLILVGLAMVTAAPSWAQAPDPFQSAPGPEAPEPRPRPRVSQPPAAGPVAPAPAGAEVVLSRHAPSGVAAPLAMETRWGPDCGAQSLETRIVERPRNGTTAIRDEPTTIPAKPRFGSTAEACIGRPILGKRVYYQSNPGFRGTDRVGYLVSYHGSEWHRFEVQITVE